MIDYINDVDNAVVAGKWELQLANFSGPLDFLLELVKVNKLEIKDIFVSQVTEQFLSYMTQLATLDVEQASEYMAMAATLLEIKSRSLLPINIDEDEQSDPQKILLKQLEEYKIFKEIVTELKVHESINRFYRDADKSVGEMVDVVSDNLSLDGFMTAFNKFLARAQARSSIENVSRAIVRETFTVADRIRYVRSALQEYGRISFQNLFLPGSSKTEIITTFSAVLEMLKLQIITVEQSELFEDFEIIASSISLNDDEISNSIREGDLDESVRQDN